MEYKHKSTATLWLYPLKSAALFTLNCDYRLKYAAGILTYDNEENLRKSALLRKQVPNGYALLFSSNTVIAVVPDSDRIPFLTTEQKSRSYRAFVVFICHGYCNTRPMNCQHDFHGRFSREICLIICLFIIWRR